ncbi:MAG: hypothetical protein ACRDD8_02885 [Bacteroidales bacterium]
MKLSEIIKSEHTVIHCSTEEEAKKLCAELHGLGLKWANGSSYADDCCFNEFGDKTGYAAKYGHYDHIYEYKFWNANIINFFRSRTL